MTEAFLLFLTLNFIFSRKVLGDWVPVAPNAKYTRVSLKQHNNLENEGPNGKCHINLSTWFMTHVEKIFQYWHPWQSSYQLTIQIRLFWNKHLASSVGCTSQSLSENCGCWSPFMYRWEFCHFSEILLARITNPSQVSIWFLKCRIFVQLFASET